MLPITLAFCAFVAFNNLSLQYNDVSFYQLMKILTTPAVVVLQLVLFKVQYRAATNVPFLTKLAYHTGNIPTGASCGTLPFVVPLTAAFQRPMRMSMKDAGQTWQLRKVVIGLSPTDALTGLSVERSAATQQL